MKVKFEINAFCIGEGEVKQHRTEKELQEMIQDLLKVYLGIDAGVVISNLEYE